MALRATDVTATNTSAANTAGDTVIAADAATALYLTHLSANYSANTGFGTVTLKSGATTVHVYPLTGGFIDVEFSTPLKFPRNTAVTATISAGGGTVTGTVNLAGYRI